MTAHKLYRLGVSYLQEAGIANPEIEASLLLCHLLQISRTELFLHQGELSKSLARTYQSLLERRGCREPLAYIIGEWEFWSLPFFVSPEVLIPRPETEVLVELVLGVFSDNHAKNEASLRILDMGAGCGILSVVLAKELSRAIIISLDIDHGAQEVARHNAGRHNVLDRISFLNADWLEAIRPEPLFDLIVANPPYVASEDLVDLQPEVRDYEPRLALDGGEKGLEEIRRFAPELLSVLKPGGYFFMEIGADQKEGVEGIFSKLDGFDSLIFYNDYANLNRVFQARRNFPGNTD